VTPFRRNESIHRLANTHYDVLVIGAGMTGAGVAVDAASRGLRVGLVDSGDVASGTSSKSSKMVHGGLRYLEQHEFRLVYENLRERQRLLENAPFLIRPLPFLIPLFAKDGLVTSAVVRGYAAALRLYDMSGGWRIGQRYQKVTRAQALARMPALDTDRLAAGFIYLDARGDDARVALTLARTAALDFDADVATYVRVVAIDHTADGLRVHCDDVHAEASFDICATTVVNATGVWADSIFSLAEHRPSQRIRPAKGVHISVASSRLPTNVAAVLRVPGERRSIFVVPFDDAPYTFIGTTDTAYEGSLEQPMCDEDDVDYLLRAVNASITTTLTREDVTGVWAGLRPLLSPSTVKPLSERTADLSRRHQVTDSNDGVVHVTGGKWTTYRQMAEDAVDALEPYFDDLARTRTRSLRLHGVSEWRPATDLETHLYRRYGADAKVVLELAHDTASLASPVIDGLAYIGAEFVYATRHEMATTLVDLLTRRTRAHLHDARRTLRAAPAIAHLVANELGWDESRTHREIESYETLVLDEFTTAGLAL
jgi:glycerol-3-phosphate dehydrogenase